jgi:hypothetical protein
MEVRDQVVDAIIEAFTTDDPAGLPAGATAEERAAADAAIGALLEQSPEPRTRWRITKILFRAYRSGDDWDDLFDRLSPFEIAELRELFPYMPARAARYFGERYVVPRA